MKSTHFTTSQIIAIIAEAAAGTRYEYFKACEMSPHLQEISPA